MLENCQFYINKLPILLNKTLQLVHKKSSHPEVFHEKYFLKSFSIFRGKHKKQPSGGVPEVFYQKLAREYLTAFAGKNLPSSPF